MTDRHLSVSVVIPTYNNAQFLQTAIKSALEQTRAADEVIIVDDGSSDDTQRVLSGFQDQIRIARHERNLGLPSARNTGIRMASGSLIAFLDADDAWLPRMVEMQVEEFSKHHDLGLCYTTLLECNELLTPLGKPRPYRRRSCERIFEELYMTAFPMPPSTVFVSRDVFERVGYFDESMLKKQDFECWLRIAMLYPVSCIPEPLCLRRVHRGALTHTRSTAENLYFEDRCFELCAAAAARYCIPLPLAMTPRQALAHRRRMLQALRSGDLKAMRVYRAAVHRDAPVSITDRIRFMLLTVRAHVQVTVNGLRRALQGAPRPS